MNDIKDKICDFDELYKSMYKYYKELWKDGV